MNNYPVPIKGYESSPYSIKCNMLVNFRCCNIGSRLCHYNESIYYNINKTLNNIILDRQLPVYRKNMYGGSYRKRGDDLYTFKILANDDYYSFSNRNQTIQHQTKLHKSLSEFRYRYNTLSSFKYEY